MLTGFKVQLPPCDIQLAWRIKIGFVLAKNENQQFAFLILPILLR
jgi:hypothetical protein